MKRHGLVNRETLTWNPRRYVGGRGLLAAEAMTQHRNEVGAGTRLDLWSSRPEKNHAGSRAVILVINGREMLQASLKSLVPAVTPTGLAGSQQALRNDSRSCRSTARLVWLQALVSLGFPCDHARPDAE